MASGYVVVGAVQVVEWRAISDSRNGVDPAWWAAEVASFPRYASLPFSSVPVWVSLLGETRLSSSTERCNGEAEVDAGDDDRPELSE